MLRRDLVSALVQVRRRRLRSKGIQSKIVEFLRENGNRESRGVSFVDVQIELPE